MPDERFDHLVASFKPKSIVPAVLSVTDIAGLVKGASEGAGLGNAFLSHIQAVDGIFHMCRSFASDEIVHVEGRIDPVADLEIIHSELRLKDLAIVTNKVESMRKNVERKVGGKEAAEEFACLEKMVAIMTEGKDIRMGDWSPAEIETINKYNMITAKPMVYLINLSMKDYVRKAVSAPHAMPTRLPARLACSPMPACPPARSALKLSSPSLAHAAAALAPTPPFSPACRTSTCRRLLRGSRRAARAT